MTMTLKQFQEEQTEGAALRLYHRAEAIDTLIMNLEGTDSPVSLDQLRADGQVPAFLLDAYALPNDVLLTVLVQWRDSCLEALSQHRGEPVTVNTLRTHFEAGDHE